MQLLMHCSVGRLLAKHLLLTLPCWQVYVTVCLLTGLTLTLLPARFTPQAKQETKKLDRLVAHYKVEHEALSKQVVSIKAQNQKLAADAYESQEEAKVLKQELLEAVVSGHDGGCVGGGGVLGRARGAWGGRRDG